MLIDEYQLGKKYRNIFAAVVCVAIAPVEVTPITTGAPKARYMIESMVTVISNNISEELSGQPADAKGTWNAICLTDMEDTGATFLALPVIPPPRYAIWMKKGTSEPIYETYMLKAMGIEKLD